MGIFLVIGMMLSTIAGRRSAGALRLAGAGGAGAGLAGRQARRGRRRGLHGATPHLRLRGIRYL